jgi:hypothetical protein
VERKDYRKFIIERAKENDVSNKKFYLEFGVWKGTSINFFSNYVNFVKMAIFDFDFKRFICSFINVHLNIIIERT